MDSTTHKKESESLHLIRKTFILTPVTMSSLNAAVLENNVGNHLQNNDVYVYEGGEVDKTERDNIKHVRIDESISAIDDYAFYECGKLQTVSCSTSHMIKTIGKSSFSECNNLLSIDLRNTKIQSVGDRAFRFCSNLSTIYFPTTANCIGQQSFYNCKKLSSLDLQATSVESIGEFAFYGCGNLTTVDFPKTLKYIGKLSFADCTNLKHFDLQETSIEKIGDYAFSRCTNLTTVVGISTSHQQQNVQESIDDYDSAILPASLIEFGKDAFYKCPKLKNGINNNWLQYEFDLNRGGRRFLQRDHHHHHHQDNDSNDDGDAKRHGKAYYSSLWPTILYRVMNEMELPKQTICPNDDNLDLYTKANPLQRRASVIFYFLVHGVVAGLQAQAQTP